MRINKYFFIFLLLTAVFCSAKNYHFFTPPQKWKLADLKHLSPMVEMCFLGKGKTLFYPSINIATEEIDISPKNYLSIVNEMHKNDPNIEFRKFGKIKTKAGPADLFELTTNTKFGTVKMLQAILVKDKKVYVLTGSMHSNEFKTMSKVVLDAFKSFQIVDDLLGCIKVSDKKQTLQNAINNLYGSKSTNDKKWKKFEKIVLKDFKNMGEYWQVLVMKDAFDKYLTKSE